MHNRGSVHKNTPHPHEECSCKHTRVSLLMRDLILVYSFLYRMTGPHEVQASITYPPNQDSSVDDRNESDTAGGWYDTLASTTVKTKSQIHSLAEGQPMHYQADYSTDKQMESEYDVIGSPNDANVPQDSKPYPMFTAEGFYAEIDKSEMKERSKSVNVSVEVPQDNEQYPVFTVEGCYAEIDKSEVENKSRSVSAPVTVAATCQPTSIPEYAVVNKPKKRKSTDNLAMPPDVPRALSSLPPLPSLPLITISEEDVAEGCENLPGENENSAEQCKDLLSENPTVMPTCTVLPLWPTATPTMAATCDTEDGCGSNSVQSCPSQLLGLEDALGSCQTVDMLDIPKIKC